MKGEKRMSTRTRYRKGGLTSKVFATLMAIVLCVGFIPYVPALAYADPGLVGGTAVFGAKAASGTITESIDITEDGEYSLADGANGVVTIGEGVSAKIVGNSFADGTYKDVKYEGLYFVVKDGATLTLENVYINNGADVQPAVDFVSSGSFNIEGTNIIDVIGNGGSLYGVVHAAGGSANTVTLGGNGTLFAYKDSGAALIGSNKDDNGVDPCANIVFKSGAWNLKGNRTGAIVGNDMASSGYGVITINGGELHLKAVARGACLGGSASGYAADVVITGGLVDCYSDFDGSAVGGAVAGKGAESKDFGTLTITGGSLKTMLGTNVASMSKAAYGFTDEDWDEASSKSTRAFVSEKAITAANDKALLVFDMGEQAGQGSTVVSVDGSAFYSGASAYGYVINELKSPQGLTSGNFLPNTAASYVGDDAIGGQAQGSSLAPDTNLYFWLSKENHVLVAGGNAYSVMWDANAGAFSLAKKYNWYSAPATEGAFEIATAEELAEFSEIVNGTAPAAIGQDDFASKTVTLTADIDLSGISGWMPIGTATAAFAGTFDGAGKAITGLSIAGGTGYTGLFGNNAGTVKDFTLAGTVAASSGDFVGAVAGFNSGTIQGVASSVEVAAGSSYNVGGIAGLSTSGTWVDSSGATQQIASAAGLISECSTNGAVTGLNKVGGIVGENAGKVSKCSSCATVDGINANKKNGVGGIVGRNGNNNTAVEEGIIDSCYFVGKVGRSGQSWVGGITGFNNAKSSVTNCYMAGELVAGHGYYNAIVGSQEGAASNNYALEGYSNSGNTEAEVGIVKTAEEMKATAFVPALNGEGAAFNMDSAGINNGFPVLAWQGGTPVSSEDITAIETAVNAIAAIGSEVTVDSKDAIEAAKAAYEALTDEQKALLPAEVQSAYDSALAAYAGALVGAIPSDVTTEAGAAAFEEALEAYSSLTDAQKALVPAASTAALISAQQAVAAAAQANLAAANNELAQAQNELAQAQNELASTNADLSAANAKVAAANAKAQAAEKARQSAAAEAAAAKAQVAQLKKDLSTASAAQGLKANPITVKAKTIKAKAGKKKTVKKSKAFTIKGAQGKVTFAKLSGNDKITITKAGKVKVKAGLKEKKKPYKVKVLVCAAGNKDYAPAVKTVTLKVKVR